MDILLTREIVEALPITVIPRSPDYIAGMTNIRGEITTLISIDNLIGISGGSDTASKKFIIFMPEFASGTNLGMIVDEVYSVLQVGEENIEYFREETGSMKNSFLRGIIRVSENGEGEDDGNMSQRLVLYLDIEKLINHLFDVSE